MNGARGQGGDSQSRQPRFGVLLAAIVFLLACGGASRPTPPGTLSDLDPATYAHRLHPLAHHFPGMNRPGKMQMMVIGDRRYLFQLVFDDDSWNWLRSRGEVLDVTDPLSPRVVNERAFYGFSINLAWHAPSQRWILMESMTTMGDPSWWAPGLRGVRFLDVTDPTRTREISRYSTDGGDPARFWQSGSGTHRDYWDGGRYAYLGAADGDAYFPERSYGAARFSRSLQILDLQSIDAPRKVGAWWVPGQKRAEVEERSRWRSAGDANAFDNFHGPAYVPARIEDGGRYGYSGWGTFGVLIHDFSDPSSPQLVGRWDSAEYTPGPMMPHHTVDVTRVDRGFVIASPESMATECKEAWHESYVLDVRDPTQIRMLSKLPRPTLPPQAPYENFCSRRGRIGPHNAPHVKAPGRAHPNITFYTYFNAGLQAFDVSDPEHPKISGWFVPAQGGKIDAPESYERGTDSVFVEWDRRLIWLATNDGLYLLSSDDLGEPVLEAQEVSGWSPPKLNAGHP